MIGSSYQTSLTPPSTNKLLLSGALIRPHCLSNRPTNLSRSRALIRAHWLPCWAWNICDWELLSELIYSPIDQRTFESGALLRVHWFPNRLTNFCDRELLLELTDSQSSTKLVWSGALIRAQWLPDRPTNFCNRQLLLSGAVIRAHLLPKRPANFLWSGAVSRARWLLNWPISYLSELIDSLIDNNLQSGAEFLLPLPIKQD